MYREYVKRVPGAMEVAQFVRDPRASLERWRVLVTFRRSHSDAVSHIPPGTGSRGVLLVIPIGDWVSAALQEGFFMKAAQFAGYDIAVCSPPGAWTNRYYHLFGVRRFVDFNAAVARARHAVVPDAADQLLSGVRTFRELLDLEYHGAHVGQFVCSTFVRKMYDGDVQIGERTTRRALHKLLSESLAYVHAAEDVFDAVRPAAVLFLERGYSPFGELFDVAIARSVNVMQWCGSHRENAFMLKRYHRGNTDQHPAALAPSTWSTLERMAWEPSLAQRVRSELAEQYRTGGWFSEVGTQFRVREMDRERIRALLALDPSKKTVVVFSHLFWDATFFWGEDLFTNYREWFTETVRAACRNDRVQWVLKLHPSNIVKLARDGYAGELVEKQAIREAIGTLPSHVRVLEPDTPISTWSLYSAIDYAVTVRGTVGIEAALFGVPVLTAGTGRYDHHGFTIDSESRVEYLQRLAYIESIPRLTPEQIERAEKFAYGTFCLRPCRVLSIQYGHRHDATATLDVKYRIHTPDDLNRARDIAAVSEWMCGNAEDFSASDTPSASVSVADAATAVGGHLA